MLLLAREGGGRAIAALLPFRISSVAEFIPLTDESVRDSFPPANLALDDYSVVSGTLIVNIVGWVETWRHLSGVVSQISYWYVQRFLHSVASVQVSKRRGYRAALFFIRLNIRAARGVKHTDSLVHRDYNSSWLSPTRDVCY